MSLSNSAERQRNRDDAQSEPVISTRQSEVKKGQSESEPIFHTISKASISSKHSFRASQAGSSVSAILALKRAKAEAARAGLDYALQEADLRVRHARINEQQQFAAAQAARERAELDADLNILEQRKQAAMAEAEVRALQSVDDNNGLSRDSLPDLPIDDPATRTELYVNDHLDRAEQTDVHVGHKRSKSSDHSNFGTGLANLTMTSLRQPRAVNIQDGFDRSPSLNRETKFGEMTETLRSTRQKNLNPRAEAYYPACAQMESSNSQPMHNEDPAMNELTRFLLKRDLLLTRLTPFDDRPEGYMAWKTGFLSIMQDLQVTPSQELDLLAKWLGPDSTKFAQSLRSANIANPRKGVERIWERLDERYGCPEMIEAALKAKLSNFPKLTNKDAKKLYELLDILSEIESVKSNDNYSNLLAYFDSSSGIIPIVSKLPHALQERWTAEAIRYKRERHVVFPPFSFFVDFIRDVSRAKNDPSFCYEVTTSQGPQKLPTRHAVSAKKTSVGQANSDTDHGPDTHCPLHKTRHPLNQCRGFRTKPIAERKQIVKDNRICFRCCASNKHLAKDCQELVQCSECGSKRHPTALHTATEKTNSKAAPAVASVGGEPNQNPSTNPSVTTNCSQICGKDFGGKSCGKTVLVKVYPEGQRHDAKLIYVIIDDQSNSSLARSEFFELFQITGKSIPYSMSSCAGHFTTSGRRAHHFMMESLDGSAKLELPNIIECNNIPNVREEIPTPEVAMLHPHLSDLARHIPPLDDNAQILLLIGRDIVEAHHVLDQRIGPLGAPYAQKLRLGWVIIGEVCLGKVHPPDKINVNKTNLLRSGRSSIFKPCPNEIKVKATFGSHISNPVDLHGNSRLNRATDIGSTVFDRTRNDGKVGLSMDDREFLHVMDREMFRSPEGNWVAPLPFRSPRRRLPNNRSQAFKRAQTLHRDLQRNATKRRHFTAFMQRVFDNKHAELAPPLSKDEECWYLPIFGVYHPQKPEQIRGVFDSSAQHKGISLNQVLLSGPDMTNNLLGVLLRFRKEPVAVTADIQQMFHCFLVREDHRNFLRFLWYRNNDPDEELVEYRMCVHVFGNSPSPAVATYGLRRAAQLGEVEFGKDTYEFVHRNFYVDDGLTSLPTEGEAVDLLKRTQQTLLVNGNLRLHKIASNSKTVMKAFPTDDRAKDLQELDLGTDSLPVQRSLGLLWDLKSDCFTFRVSREVKPFTRRGILSTVNSLFDPLGFLAPVVIQGKILIRDLISDSKDWDEPLNQDRELEWEQWRLSLETVERINIPRIYVGTSLNNIDRREVHVYSDASEKAISAVAYLKTVDKNGDVRLGFIIGKSKVAPGHGHTIPRLELCAAVLATELGELITDNLDITPDVVNFYTDSKVVLGYIHNQTRRFQIYVSNRIDRIRRFSLPSQWRYVRTDLNPADQGTRPISATEIENSEWINGPTHLKMETQEPPDTSFSLVDPESDKELKRQTVAMTTSISSSQSLGSDRFARFSSWRTLVKTIAHLKHVAHSFHDKNETCKGWHNCNRWRTIELYHEAEKLILINVQADVFSEDLHHIREGTPLPKGSSLRFLNPMLNSDGLLCVGGRLSSGEVDENLKHPIIIHRSHNAATLLVRHFHENVEHQGRHFTEGALRDGGFWIIGAKRLISSVINRCVKCRKLRGKQESQKMADLPADRLTPSPPFTYVGLDMFGPWSVVSRRTRGGQANDKRWAILFTCLASRAVHIEVVEDMGTSSFINALRRFIALRGKVSQFRSDRGTNFIGCTDSLKIDAINVEDTPVRNFLYQKGVTWIFNPPHSSHMGGVWERMIGITRRILDSMMSKNSSRNLTHEVLCTLLTEVSAIINARPIVPVSSDPECTVMLSPQTLLTQKMDHVAEPLGNWDYRDLYRAQWKHVQALADVFWNRWRREYLQTLQIRRKWRDTRPNISPGDVVLLSETNLNRNEWPVGIVETALASDDGNVRKVVVRINRDGKSIVYTRPVTQLVLLVPDSEAK